MKKILLAALIMTFAIISLSACKKEHEVAPIPETVQEDWRGFFLYMGQASKEMEKMSENLQK